MAVFGIQNNSFAPSGMPENWHKNAEAPLQHRYLCSSAMLSMLFRTAICASQHSYLCPSAPLGLSFSKSEEMV
jgi:hypothetical protein